jgi:hypothetical protein
MGCDVIWSGSQSDQLKQRKAGLLIQLLTEDYDIDRDTYNGLVEGCIIITDRYVSRNKPIIFNKINLIGTESLKYDCIDLDEDERCDWYPPEWLRNRFTVAFMNSPDVTGFAPGQIVSILKILAKDIDVINHVNRFYKITNVAPETDYYLIKKDGNLRVSRGAAWINILGIIKMLYVPNLEMCDDHGSYEVFPKILSKEKFKETPDTFEEKIRLIQTFFKFDPKSITKEKIDYWLPKAMFDIKPPKPNDVYYDPRNAL